jgi:hypothetical protein
MRKLFYFLIITAGTIGFQACSEDYFGLTNPPEFPWLNVDEFERAAVSPYNYAFYSGWGGHYFIADRVVRDCMTDLCYRIPGASANYFIDPVYQRQTDIDDGRNQQSFSAAYDAIGIINTALDFYYENDGDPYPDLDPDDKVNNVGRIAGELHFMRAFSYLHQVHRHCPPPGSPDYSTQEILPLRVNFTDAEAALNAEFVTTERIYEQILEDLLKAKLLLPEQYVDGLHHPSYQYGRADKFTAHALLSRVYFQLGEWDLAEAELDTVIEMNGGRFTLDQDPIEAFNRSDNTQGNEVIWQNIAYDEEHGQTPVQKDATLFTFLDYRAVNGGLGDYYRRSTWHIFSMSNTIAKQVGWMNDELSVTAEAMRDKRYTQLFYRLEGNRGITDDDPQIYEQQYPQVKEPRIWGNKYFRGTDGMHTNIPVIRLAEMYLTRSIIRFTNGELAGAADDLNRVRERAWDAAVAGTDYSASDQFVTADNITEEMIHNERIKELGFEGDRMTYLMALRKAIPPGDREGTEEVAFPYDGMFWTIPQSELDFKLDN